MSSCKPSEKPEGQPKPKAIISGRGPGQSQPHRAKPQGPPTQRESNRFDELPDLRFLNYNHPPISATSIINPESVNSANVPQVQALKHAEAWFSATVTMLQDRLVLCERLRHGLVEVNALLARIEMVRKGQGDRESAILPVTTDPKQGVDLQPTREAKVNNPIAPLEKATITEDDLRSMEAAIAIWLRDIRVSRAKWIAGGRNMEKRIGLR